MTGRLDFLRSNEVDGERERKPKGASMNANCCDMVTLLLMTDGRSELSTTNSSRCRITRILLLAAISQHSVSGLCDRITAICRQYPTIYIEIADSRIRQKSFF